MHLDGMRRYYLPLPKLTPGCSSRLIGERLESKGILSPMARGSVRRGLERVQADHRPVRSRLVEGRYARRARSGHPASSATLSGSRPKTNPYFAAKRMRGGFESPDLSQDGGASDLDCAQEAWRVRADPRREGRWSRRCCQARTKTLECVTDYPNGGLLAPAGREEPVLSLVVHPDEFVSRSPHDLKPLMPRTAIFPGRRSSG